MFTPEFWAENWIKLLFGLLSTGIIAYLSFLVRKYKRLRSLEDKQDNEEIEEMIDKKLEESIAPVLAELDLAKTKFDAIKESYRYRLIALCELYLNRGYLVPQEYHQLSEMWKVYHELGGNSQAEDYYRKVEELPIRETQKEKG